MNRAHWLGILTLTACNSAPLINPDTVHDSTGLSFGWDCSTSSLCETSETPTVTFAPPCENAEWGRSWGRFYELCVVCPFPDRSGWTTTSNLCRPLACDVDAECPQVESSERIDVYECVEGLCQNTDTSLHPRSLLTPNDARVLCYADVAREDSADFSASATRTREAALGSECPLSAPSCTLPAACLAP